jgi:hypothetical protein
MHVFAGQYSQLPGQIAYFALAVGAAGIAIGAVREAMKAHLKGGGMPAAIALLCGIALVFAVTRFISLVGQTDKVVKEVKTLPNTVGNALKPGQ